MHPLLSGASSVTLSQALHQSDHAFIWQATLRDGSVILEQPGLSSDHLPRDEVTLMEYVPKRPGLPAISCRLDLAKGERFVRYWSTIWKNGGHTQRLYIIGVESKEGKHSLLAFYPSFKKIVLADTRPFQPPWDPNPFACVANKAVMRGGPGTSHIGWVHEGFGAHIQMSPNGLDIHAIYE